MVITVNCAYLYANNPKPKTVIFYFKVLFHMFILYTYIIVITIAG